MDNPGPGLLRRSNDLLGTKARIPGWEPGAIIRGVFVLKVAAGNV